jgi:hypothetical protein
MEFILLTLSLFATTIGAMTGFGGGFIIKPLLDAAAIYDTSTISVLSSVTVLTMAVTTTIRYKANHVQYGKNVLYLSAGSAAGGYFGKLLFSLLVRLSPDTTMKIIQAAVLICLLIVILFQNRYKRFLVVNPLLILLAGAALGVISSFLGIGGGPFNVVILCILFSINVKDAAVYSIFIILCSQAVSVGAKLAGGEIIASHLYSLAFMVPAAIAGGFLGAHIACRLSEQSVKRLYFGTVIMMLAINIWIVIRESLIILS